ncbi:MAG: biopolymer transporter ExbD [Alphaproteobacteria bacterium]|nr:biopolymer transporter ExbD [Alphaproteobacteria bacterium]
MKIKRSRTNKKAKIEIIPMIDVMFFLLATFVMASLAMQKINGMAVNLNKGTAENIENIKDSITITITHDNQIFINNNNVLLTEISSFVEKLINDKNNNILIASDTDSKQGVVMQTMLEAKKAGAKKFSFVIKNQ